MSTNKNNKKNKNNKNESGETPLTPAQEMKLFIKSKDKQEAMLQKMKLNKKTI